MKHPKYEWVCATKSPDRTSLKSAKFIRLYSSWVTFLAMFYRFCVYVLSSTQQLLCQHCWIGLVCSFTNSSKIRCMDPKTSLFLPQFICRLPNRWCLYFIVSFFCPVFYSLVHSIMIPPLYGSYTHGHWLCHTCSQEDTVVWYGDTAFAY